MEIAAKFLELSAQKAWEYQALTYPNPAVGAAVVKNGLLVSLEAHKKAGAPHAEVEALKAAFFALSGESDKKELLSKLQTSHEIHNFLTQNATTLFGGCDIYVTLEPCAHEGRTPSCAKLLSTLKPQCVIVGTKEQNIEATGGCDILSQGGVKTIFADNLACNELTEPFFKWKNDGGFTFFKLALTMNGRISGGKISCEDSFHLVHAIRDKIDLLVIGANTVRIDRPTLDARLTGGRAPNVFIYSKTDSLDKTIPLFGVANRKVIISNSLETIKNYNFTMIEGGGGMLKATRDIVSHYLFFISTKLSGDCDLDAINLSFKILHSRAIDKDLLIWAKRNDV